MTRSGKPVTEGTVFVDEILNEKRPLNGLSRDYASAGVQEIGARGTSSFDKLRAARYRVRAEGANGRRPLRKTASICDPVVVEVTRDEAVATIQLVAVPDPVTRGQLVGAKGNAIAGSIVGFAGRPHRPFRFPQQNAVSGAFVTPPMPPGVLTIAYPRPAQVQADAVDSKQSRWLKTRIDAGARHAKIVTGPITPLGGRAVRASDGKALVATVVLQDAATRLQRYPSSNAKPAFAFADATAGEHLLWAFTRGGLFAEPMRVTTREGGSAEDQRLTLRQGAILQLDASGRDRHLRCDIKLPSGESLERILVGVSPKVTVPAGPIEVALEEIDGDWRATWSLDLAPGEILLREAR